MDDPAQTASAEAIETAAAHAQAVETSRVEHLNAMLSSPELSKTLEDAVVRALGRGASENRYIDIGRIPFICDDISAINKSLQDITKSLSTYPLVKMLVFGCVSLILVAVIGELLWSIGLGHYNVVSGH